MMNKIQVSPETADYLQIANKGSWLEPRDVKVFVKGKGHLQTYWLTKKEEAQSQASSNDCIARDQLDGIDSCASKASRLVNWNAEEMKKLLKQVVARRKAGELREKMKKNGKARTKRNSTDSELLSFERPLDEVKDVVKLPDFDVEMVEFEKKIPQEAIELDNKVACQLTDLVTRIANLYQANPFHNFEHAR